MANEFEEIERIWPHWKIEALIGRGTFGQVYKAKKEQMGIVSCSAIKRIRIPRDAAELRELRYSHMDDEQIRAYYEELVQELSNEIRIMQSLKSVENIVGIEDFEIVKDPDHFVWDIYLRLEYLTGLGSYIQKGRLRLADVVRLGIGLCSALSACEQEHILHRDIKIDNVFVSERGTFKLGDFGISRRLEQNDTAFSQKGTNLYMAPEVMRGEVYDHRADLYSLGILLYRLLNNGRFPFFDADSVTLTGREREEAIRRRLDCSPLPKPCDADGRLFGILKKACAFDPGERYADAAAMREALEKYGAGCEDRAIRLSSPTEAADRDEVTERLGRVPVPKSVKAKKRHANKKRFLRVRRRLLPAGAAVLLLLALLALLRLYLHRGGGEQGELSTLGTDRDAEYDADNGTDSFFPESDTEMTVITTKEVTYDPNGEYFFSVYDSDGVESKRYHYSIDGVLSYTTDLTKEVDGNLYKLTMKKYDMQGKLIETNYFSCTPDWQKIDGEQWDENGTLAYTFRYSNGERVREKVDRSGNVISTLTYDENGCIIAQLTPKKYVEVTFDGQRQKSIRVYRDEGRGELLYRYESEFDDSGYRTRLAQYSAKGLLMNVWVYDKNIRYLESVKKTEYDADGREKRTGKSKKKQTSAAGETEQATEETTPQEEQETAGGEGAGTAGNSSGTDDAEAAGSDAKSASEGTDTGSVPDDGGEASAGGETDADTGGQQEQTDTDGSGTSSGAAQEPGQQGEGVPSTEG